MTTTASGGKEDLYKGYTFRREVALFRQFKNLVENATHILPQTQSNFDRLYLGGVRVAVASFTPIEKGFHILHRHTPGAIKLFAKRKQTDYLISPKLHNSLAGYDTVNVEQSQDQLTDYFIDMLQPEYEYLISYSSKPPRTVQGVRYSVRFPKNAKELIRNLADDSILNILLSIEGMHALMPAPSNEHVFQNQTNGHINDENSINHNLLQLLQERVQHIKQNWAAAPFFITLNHHFWNGLGGHSLSLNRTVLKVVSQQEGIHTGLNANGEIAIKYLLGSSLGKRILIDVKHMSAKCRKEFYEYISNERELRQTKHPIICSHTGICSKFPTLDSLISINEELEQEDSRHFLFESGINLCTQDLQFIQSHGGLVGIQLDEKRIAGKSVVKKLKKKYEKAGKSNLLYIKMVWANIFQGIRALNNVEAWSLFCIGSDYDGLINHLDPYPTCSDFKALRKDMLAFLKNPEDIADVEFDFVLRKEDIERLMFGLSPNTIIEMIFAKNVIDFLEKHFT